jgi:hypothetical protein
MPELPLLFLGVAAIAIVGVALGMLVSPWVGRLAGDDEPDADGPADGGTGDGDDREADR